MATNTYTFTWRVENFSLSCKSTGESIDSPPFTVDLLGSTTYKLKLYPRGLTDENWVSLELERTDDNGPDEVHIGVKVTLTPPDDTTSITVSKSQRRFVRQNTVQFHELVSCVQLRMHSYVAPAGEEPVVVRCQMWAIPPTPRWSTEGAGRTQVRAKRVNGTLWVVQQVERLVESKLDLPSSEDKLVGITLKNREGALKMDAELCRQERPFYLSCQVTVVDAVGDPYEINHVGHLFDASSPPKWSCPDVITSIENLLADPDRLLHDGDLHLIVDLSYSFEEDVAIAEEVKTSPLSLPEVQAKGYIDCVMSQRDLLKAYQEKEGCDITLVSKDGTPIRAHKSVLCSKSAVFRSRIFPPDHQDEGQSLLAVPEVDGDTLDQFLMFLYADCVRDLCFELAVRLYDAAVAYAVHSLAQLCDVYIKFRVSHEDLSEVVEGGAGSYPGVRNIARDIAKRRRAIFSDPLLPKDKRDELLEVYGGLAKKRKLKVQSRQPKDDLMVAQAQEWLDNFLG